MRNAGKKMGGKGMAKRKPRKMSGSMAPPMAPPMMPQMMASGGKVRGYAKGGMVKKGKC